MVTGTGRGVGRGIVPRRLAREGCDIVGIDVAFEPEDEKKGLFEVKETGRGARRPLPARSGRHLARVGDHDRMLDAAAYGVCGRIDVLVSNAGVSPLERRDILETSPESYDRLMAINARGPFFLTQNAAKRMVAQKPRRGGVRPAIVFITSISASVSSTSRPEYCVSKAALSMTATLFADVLSGRGIDVFEVRPGIIATDMTAAVKKKYDRLIAGGLVPRDDGASPRMSDGPWPPWSAAISAIRPARSSRSAAAWPSAGSELV